VISSAEYIPEPGDVFACWGSDWISRGISLPTSSLIGPRGVRWAPSHVAIACPRWYPHHERCFWWESTSLTDRTCLESGKEVSGVQVHEISGRLHDYVNPGGRVSVYRLTKFDVLTSPEVSELRKFLGDCLAENAETESVPYDTKGALISGTRLIRRITLWRNQLDTLFCSELLAAALQRLGLMCRENPSWFTPARLMRRLLIQGTYHLHTEFRSLQNGSDKCFA
jgi:hypothetical protein